mmetsp:Transcript_49327/g.88648  ORF Transcript_49327/g.88648 Transcript_49327/m.88648 type:complete len:215 (-) Transcript_49327:339-983(-)
MRLSLTVTCLQLSAFGIVQDWCKHRDLRCLCSFSSLSLLLHGQCQLQRLLLPSFNNFFPELALMLHTLKLGLDVLLGNLQQAKHAVIGLFGNHIQDVAEALRAALAPSLVNPKGHVLGTLFPAKKLHVSLSLVSTFSIIELWSWEDTNNLGKFDHTLCQRCNNVLEILERLLVHLRVEHIMYGIHLRLPVLLVHVSLLFHLSDGIAVLLDVHFV